MHPYIDQQWQKERGHNRIRLSSSINILERVVTSKSTTGVEAVIVSFALGLLRSVVGRLNKNGKSSRLRYTKRAVKESMKRFDCMFGDKNDKD